ncbi:hypothetical protein BD779DRAFT_1507260 [Infundibulicybe gibba]|nr:hypothetical protein BD779DRAFT_1507260 [Infundibulicybe gibba]
MAKIVDELMRCGSLRGWRGNLNWRSSARTCLARSQANSDLESRWPKHDDPSGVLILVIAGLNAFYNEHCSPAWRSVRSCVLGARQARLLLLGASSLRELDRVLGSCARRRSKIFTLWYKFFGLDVLVRGTQGSRTTTVEVRFFSCVSGN